MLNELNWIQEDRNHIISFLCGILELSYNLSINLICRYTLERKRSVFLEDISALMLIAALFRLVKLWYQLMLCVIKVSHDRVSMYLMLFVGG